MTSKRRPSRSVSTCRRKVAVTVSMRLARSAVAAMPASSMSTSGPGPQRHPAGFPALGEAVQGGREGNCGPGRSPVRARHELPESQSLRADEGSAGVVTAQ
jgi:hypothetical protein